MSSPAPSRRLEAGAVLSDTLVRELLDARLVCVLAMFDGAEIHAVPMWYAAGEGCVLLATGSRSRKVRNLRANPVATLVVHDSRPGFEVCGVSMTGHVEVVRGDGAQELVDRVHERYVDPTAADDPEVELFLSSDDVALRFLPHAALTWDERGSGARAALRARGGARPLASTDPRP